MAVHVLNFCPAERFNIDLFFISCGLCHFEALNILNHGVVQNICGRLSTPFACGTLSVLEITSVFWSLNSRRISRGFIFVCSSTECWYIFMFKHFKSIKLFRPGCPCLRLPGADLVLITFLVPRGYCGPFSRVVFISFSLLLFELFKNGHSVLLKSHCLHFSPSQQRVLWELAASFRCSEKFPWD